MSKEIQMRQALENAEATINYLAGLPDKILSEKLDTVHIQMVLAAEKKNTPALELLEIWRSQIIEARIYKAENDIPDAPNEIELAVADVETFTAKAEERQELLKEFSTPLKQTIQKVQKEKNDNQLELF